MTLQTTLSQSLPLLLTATAILGGITAFQASPWLGINAPDTSSKLFISGLSLFALNVFLLATYFKPVAPVNSSVVVS